MTDRKVDMAENRLSGCCIYCGKEDQDDHSPACNTVLMTKIDRLIGDVSVISSRLSSLETEDNSYEVATMVDSVRTFADILTARHDRNKMMGRNGKSPF